MTLFLNVYVIWITWHVNSVLFHISHIHISMFSILHNYSIIKYFKRENISYDIFIVTHL